MSNPTSRLSYLNQINYIHVITSGICCLIIGISYIIGGFRLACPIAVCGIIIIIIWYLIKTGRITTGPDNPPVCHAHLITLCDSTIVRIFNSNYNILHDSIPVHMLVNGETFNTHDTFRQKLNLQIELCSAESSNVILVFCPVVSRIGTDMEAAMAKVTVNKPVILVFMHHCHDPSHMTNITVQPSRSNIVQVVHCAFYESTGLLECQENKQAVTEVCKFLQKYRS